MELIVGLKKTEQTINTNLNLKNDDKNTGRKMEFSAKKKISKALDKYYSLN